MGYANAITSRVDSSTAAGRVRGLGEISPSPSPTHTLRYQDGAKP